MDKLRMYAKEEKFDILDIAKTWLHDTVENNEIYIIILRDIVYTSGIELR